VRRTINLICALALLAVGAYWFVDLPLYAFHPEGIIVVALGAAAATFLGLYLLIRGGGIRRRIREMRNARPLRKHA
jgi:hypothetical protein